MKYTAPIYNNEMLEAEDVITASIAIEVNKDNLTGSTKAEDILGM